MAYIEFNGEPLCTSDWDADMADFERAFTAMGGRTPTCSSRDPENVARILREVFPKARVVVMEGGCPSYDENEHIRAELTGDLK